MDDEDGVAHSNEVAHGTAWNLVGAFIGKILSFLYTIYIARVITQDDVGLFYLALGIIGLVSVWKDLGLPTALVRYIPFYESKNQHRKAFDLLRDTLAINVVIGAALTALVWFLADPIGALYQNAALPEVIRLLCAYVLLDNVGRTLTSYLQGKAEMKIPQLIGNLQVLAKLIITIVLVQAYGPGLVALCGGYILPILITIPMFIPIVVEKAGLKKGIAAEGPRLGREEIVREIAPFGIMLTIINTFNALMSSADRAILGYLAPVASSAAMVATYSFAITLAGNVLVFPGTVGAIFLPVISRLVGKGDMAAVKKQVGIAQRWVLFITLPLAAVMFAYSTEMLTIFFGSAYGGGGLAMSIFVAGLVFNVFALTVSLALAGMRLVHLELKVSAISATANVILNFALIPFFGINGAAAATAISFAIWGALMLKYGKEKIGFESPRESYKLVAIGIGVAIVALALKPAVTIAQNALPALVSGELAPYAAKVEYLLLLGAVSVFSCALFVAGAVVFKCFGKEDAKVLRMMGKKVFLPEPILIFGEQMVEAGMPGAERT